MSKMSLAQVNIRSVKTKLPPNSNVLATSGLKSPIAAWVADFGYFAICAANYLELAASSFYRCSVFHDLARLSGDQSRGGQPNATAWSVARCPFGWSRAEIGSQLSAPALDQP